MEQVKVLMNDGLEYVGYVSSCETYITIYTDGEDDAFMVGTFDLRGDELWAEYLMSETEECVGRVIG